MSYKRHKQFFVSVHTLLTACAAVFAASAPGIAHEYELGKLKVEHPWLRTPADAEKPASLFMKIYNNGDAEDKLVGVKSGKVDKVTVYASPQHIVWPHGVVIPPHGEVTLAPGGPHVDLLTKKLNPVGWGFEVTLVFEKAGEATIDAAVEAPDAAHAHDAEATERWEKAHAAPTAPVADKAAPPPSPSAGPHEATADASGSMHEGHHHHHHETSENLPDPFAADRNSFDHSGLNHGVPGLEPQ
jgi:periplasmic copper chaperone A